MEKDRDNAPFERDEGKAPHPLGVKFVKSSTEELLSSLPEGAKVSVWPGWRGGGDSETLTGRIQGGTDGGELRWSSEMPAEGQFAAVWFYGGKIWASSFRRTDRPDLLEYCDSFSDQWLEVEVGALAFCETGVADWVLFLSLPPAEAQEVT